MLTPDRSAPRRARVDALADDIATLVASIDAATHKLLTAIRQFDAERGWALQGAKSMVTWLTWRTGCSPHTAREYLRAARALGELPKMDAALREGAINFSKVRAMTRVATPENEELLLSYAETATGAQLEKVCSSFQSVRKKYDPTAAPTLTDEDHRYIRRRIKRDGTIVLEVRVLPDEADAIMKAIRLTKDELEAEHRIPEGTPPSPENVPEGTSPSPENVPEGTPPSPDPNHLNDENVPEGTPPAISLPDALVAMAHQKLATLEEKTPPPKKKGRPKRSPTAKRRELLIHLRTSDLVKGAFTAELHDGVPLDGATFCRLACDTGVVVAHTSDDGDPLDVGRRRRTIPPALMRALRLRDRGCTFPGCTHLAFVEAHHLEHWSNGGTTSKDNLVLLCHTHHVALHEGGFSAELKDGAFVFRDPDGRPIPAYPKPATPKPTPPIDDPKTNLIRWDGRPMNLMDAVSGLVKRDLGCNH